MIRNNVILTVFFFFAFRVQAHKLILSACSPYFETIFQENPCKHPTVIMRGVTLNEMQSLCQYMYVGSVEVQESSLSSLLKVARELQIKGWLEKIRSPTSRKMSIIIIFFIFYVCFVCAIVQVYPKRRCPTTIQNPSQHSITHRLKAIAPTRISSKL